MINKTVVQLERQKHLCLDKNKIESALHAAFYPGSFPFHYGGAAKVAGALCYFLVKAHAFLDGNKRTAGISAATFLDLNQIELVYPIDESKDLNEYASILDKCAASIISKDDLINWFEYHKQ